MGEINLQEDGLESTLVFSLLCEKNRNSDGFWEQVCKSYEYMLDEKADCALNADGLPERFSGGYPLLCEKGGKGMREKKLPGNREMGGCYYIVSNKGGIFGEYNKEQRL
jgi:hypothetical protein